jgi:hypothetical protein
MKLVNPNSVDAREGLAVGEYAVCRIADVQALEAENGRLREAITKYRYWFDTCTRTLADNWEELAATASEELDAALSPAPADPPRKRIGQDFGIEMYADDLPDLPAEPIPTWCCEGDGEGHHTKDCRYTDPNIFGAPMAPADPRWEAMERVCEAARRLADRLIVVHGDKRYASVWTISQLHVGPYSGPTYTRELDDLDAALAALDKEADHAD